jgi:hypothetical protein
MEGLMTHTLTRRSVTAGLAAAVTAIPVVGLHAAGAEPNLLERVRTFARDLLADKSKTTFGEWVERKRIANLLLAFIGDKPETQRKSCSLQGTPKSNFDRSRLRVGTFCSVGICFVVRRFFPSRHFCTLAEWCFWKAPHQAGLSLLQAAHQQGWKEGSRQCGEPTRH